ncbi:SBBP repeat-containing protein [Myxosarcina sp. GI1(2024)]
MNSFNDNYLEPFISNAIPIFYSTIAPIFFQDNLANTVQDTIQIITPSSDYNSLLAERGSQVIWGRHGNDSLVAYDPGAVRPNQWQIDIFLGDFVDENFIDSLGLVGQDASRTLRKWQDRFILGDWRQPYYTENQPHIFGLNQFAVIIDFSPSQDLIQLHGTPEDYRLVSSPLGTAIFWQQETSSDLIALLPGVPRLHLNDRSLQFEGNTPPSGPILDKVKQVGTAGFDFIFDSTVDDTGNVYVGGGTTGALAGTLSGSRDAWLAKFDRNGDLQWSQQFGTSGVESAWALANDGSNIYVVGDTSGDLANTNQGGRDAYLAKFDSDGNVLWSEQLGSSALEQTFGVITDKQGNVYVSGQSVGDLGGTNFNVGQNLGSTEANQSTILRTTDSFMTKFDSDGNQLWLEKFGTPELDDFYNIAIDEDGNVFAGGPTTSDFEGEDAELYDSWLVKLDNNGELQWLEQFGSPDYEFLWDIDTDLEGNVYATGWTLGDLEGENAGSYDTWVVKYDTNGNQLWIRQFGTSGDDGSGFVFGGIDVDSNNDIFVTGATDGNLGGENAGSYDAWVAKYDSAGNQLWLEQFGTPDYDVGGSVTTDNAGSLYVTGFTEGSLGNINAGAVDGWIAKFDSDSGSLQDFTGNIDRNVNLIESQEKFLEAAANQLPIDDTFPFSTTELTSSVDSLESLAEIDVL